MAGGRLTGLDGVRGVAAIAVAFFYAHISFVRFPHGYLAVDLFFMLSGFVLARCYEPALRGTSEQAPLGLGRYAAVRLRRLYPMLALGGAVGVANWALGLSEFTAKGSGDAALAIVSQFALIPFLCSAGWFAFNRVQWTILFELGANLLHAAALPLLEVGALAAIIGTGALGLGLGARACGHLDAVCPSETLVVAVCAARTVFGFFAGVLLYRTRAKWEPRVPALSFALVAALVLFALGVPLPPLAGGAALFDVACVTLLFPVIVMVGARAEAGRAGLALGVLSYPLYAIHLPLIDAIRRAGSGEALAAGLMLAIIALAWAIGHWLDVPLAARAARLRHGAGGAARMPAKGGDTPPRFA